MERAQLQQYFRAPTQVNSAAQPNPNKKQKKVKGEREKERREINNLCEEIRSSFDFHSSQKWTAAHLVSVCSLIPFPVSFLCFLFWVMKFLIFDSYIFMKSQIMHQWREFWWSHVSFSLLYLGSRAVLISLDGPMRYCSSFFG